jgi:hypothetical protein
MYQVQITKVRAAQPAHEPAVASAVAWAIGTGAYEHISHDDAKDGIWLIDLTPAIAAVVERDGEYTTRIASPFSAELFDVVIETL